jgi:heavy metal-binding protein
MTCRAMLCALLVCTGCSHTSEPPPPIDHPANPQAAEAPAPAPRADATPDAPTAYTCPHHPGVMQAEPGECPICNMKLEPTTSRQTSPLRAAPTEPKGQGHEGHSK